MSCEAVTASVPQKIYLFAPEGSTQDRGRPRPPSAIIASPAKRAKTGNLDDAEKQEQHMEAEEQEEQEHQAAEREEGEGNAPAERDQFSTSNAYSTVAHA